MDEDRDVGATDLLLPEASQILTADYSLRKAELARLVAGWLADEAKLLDIGARAAQKARQWTEPELGLTLTKIIEGVVQGDGVNGLA